MQSRFDCIKAAIDQIDFDGKTVLDLASAVGYYSYMATHRLAKHVHLCDKDEGTMQYDRMKMTDKVMQADKVARDSKEDKALFNMSNFLHNSGVVAMIKECGSFDYRPFIEMGWVPDQLKQLLLDNPPPNKE